MTNIHLLYTPVKNKSMNVAVFASGGGNNLLTAIQTAHSSSGKIRICLVVTDRLRIPAIDIAKSHGISVISRDFEKECGVWKECKEDPIKAQQYRKAAEQFHDTVLDEILAFQHTMRESIDLVVLSYHRLIQGKLLSYFQWRIINQHPADLTIMREGTNERKYIGLSPVYDALSDGKDRTRTTNFLVREGCDDGEILCSGPWVPYKGERPVTRKAALKHEILQKKVSDTPCLHFVLTGISEGRFGIHQSLSHADGGYVVTYDQKPLPYEGIDLSTYVSTRQTL